MCVCACVCVRVCVCVCVGGVKPVDVRKSILRNRNQVREVEFWSIK